MSMNNPISTIMTKKLITVIPTDSLQTVDDLFKQYNIHHILVVRHRNVEGIISKADLQALKRGDRLQVTGFEGLENSTILSNFEASSLMTKGVAKVYETDKIGVAAELFLKNYFHSVPVINEAKELVGIVTVYDIIKYFFEKDYPSQVIKPIVE